MFVIWIMPWWLVLIILWMNTAPSSEEKRERRWFAKWYELTARSERPGAWPGDYLSAGLSPEEAAKRHLEKYPAPPLPPPWSPSKATLLTVAGALVVFVAAWALLSNI
jgi:hypothetical protein